MDFYFLINCSTSLYNRPMKKLKSLRIFFLATLFVMAFSAVAFAGAQDFTLVNNTGYDIHYVNVSPSSSDDWQNDILGSSILPNGSSVNVTFNTNDVQYWDIQATFDDGSSLSWSSIDLLSVATVTLNGDGTASLE